MEEEGLSTRKKFLCFGSLNTRTWLWTYTAVPSGLRFVLHLAATVLDVVVACRLLESDRGWVVAALTLALVYTPVLLTLLLTPPQPPRGTDLTDLLAWTISLATNIIISPILISMSLFKHFNWTIWAIRMQKPCTEVLAEYEENLPREIHSYLFLQAFTHCGPQSMLQLHLLLLGVADSQLTVVCQAVRIAVGMIRLAWCVAEYHRYQAQVVGGRPPVLLLSPPQLNPSSQLLPVSACFQGKVTAIQRDSPMGQLVLFTAWLLLISGRILCLVVSLEVHISATATIVSIHFFIILLYLLTSQPTSLYKLPSRFVSAFFSLTSLVEVSVHFHKTALLYGLFFILLFAEDTFLMVFFFIYRSDKCLNNVSCTHFGMYAYFVINSHVIGVILFGIYLSCLQPPHIPVSASSSEPSTPED